MIRDIAHAGVPFGLRKPGVVLGALILIAVAAALVSARAIPFFLLAIVVGHVVLALAEGRRDELRPRFGWPERALALFLAWAAVSALWALDAVRTLTAVGCALAIMLAATVTARGASVEPREGILRMAEGLWLGFALGLVYFLVELLTEQSIKIWVYNFLGVGPDDVKAAWFTFSNGRLVAIEPVDLTRNAAPISLLLWPCLMAVLGVVEQRWKLCIAALVGLLAASVVFLSPHEASKFALVAGALVFALCRLSSVWTWRGLGAAWIAACLLIVPAVLLAHRLDLHNAPWLQNSAQHRIVIWNYTALETLRRPVFGAGALTTYVTGQFVKPAVANAPGERQERTLSQHAHNVFLQTWYELGLIGALFLLGTGLAFVARLGRLGVEVQPFAAALFASGMVMAGTSYGLWQTWFMALYGLTAIAFAVGARAYQTPPSAEEARRAERTTGR